MITGFNTDIKHNEKVYHIQTEDKGLANPYIESLVYVGGEILASKKTSYADKVKEGIGETEIGTLMEHQHRTMIAAIKRGKFDSLDHRCRARRRSRRRGRRIAARPTCRRRRSNARRRQDARPGDPRLPRRRGGERAPRALDPQPVRFRQRLVGRDADRGAQEPVADSDRRSADRSEDDLDGGAAARAVPRAHRSATAHSRSGSTFRSSTKAPRP